MVEVELFFSRKEAGGNSQNLRLRRLIFGRSPYIMSDTVLGQSVPIRCASLQKLTLSSPVS